MCCDWSFHIPVLCGSCKTERMDSLRVSNEEEFQTRVKNRGQNMHVLTHTNTHPPLHDRARADTVGGSDFFFQPDLHCKDLTTHKDVDLCLSMLISLDIKSFCEEVLHCLYGIFNSLCACCVHNKSVFLRPRLLDSLSKRFQGLVVVETQFIVPGAVKSTLTYCKEIAI